MNNRLSLLQPYPFEKLAKLKQGITPPAEKYAIALSIGEPQHAAPEIVLNAYKNSADKLSHYPKTKGSNALRDSIAHWLSSRFLNGHTPNSDTQILPVNGTREALFSLTQAIISSDSNATVLMPNPFYQIYEGAALLAGATPIFLPCLPENDFLPDLDNIAEDALKRCELFFICTPGNPTGALADIDYFKKLIALADKYDFIIVSDECYSEIYQDEANPPIGILQACQLLGRNDFQRCVALHSLSKRSNLPGLRSGFVAGDAHIIKPFLLYRTYHGCAMSDSIQQASIAAWNDEEHVKQNRQFYREKYQHFASILSPTMAVNIPPASFYLWLQTPIDDRDFAQKLFQSEHITVLPGQFLSRNINGINPGENRVRLALVASVDDCIEAAHRIKRFCNTL